MSKYSNEFINYYFSKQPYAEIPLILDLAQHRDFKLNVVIVARLRLK